MSNFKFHSKMTITTIDNHLEIIATSFLKKNNTKIKLRNRLYDYYKYKLNKTNTIRRNK